MAKVNKIEHNTQRNLSKQTTSFTNTRVHNDLDIMVNKIKTLFERTQKL